MNYLAKAVHISLLAIFSLSIVIGKEHNPAIRCKVANMPPRMVVLEMIEPTTTITPVDSVITDGNIVFSGKLISPGLYRLHFSNQQYIILSTDGHDISITADWSDLAAYKVVSGAATSELAHFINGFKVHLRDINTMTIVVDTLTARNDWAQLKKARAEQTTINDKAAAYVEKYAMNTQYEPNAIFAANLLTFAQDDLFSSNFSGSLKRRFPHARMTKEYLQHLH